MVIIGGNIIINILIEKFGLIDTRSSGICAMIFKDKRIRIVESFLDNK